MGIESGQQIGPYKVVSPIGAGGMGEVYLADDARLDRKVALKVLSAKVSTDSNSLDRFKQEAKAASALNHPNIVTVYEIGEHEGLNYIATEFIAGQTLRERLRDRLSFDDALSIAIQMAEALSAAHEAGITHRDIKPENVMIRPDGYIKVLDFGLAKLNEGRITNADSEGSTKVLVKTNPGLVMGTVSYMSPEQARGKEVDVRSDVFSFGIVMYEMLVGKMPFGGDTITEIIAAIINAEADPLNITAPHLPRELQRIVHKTLRKKREQRYNSTRDLLGDLKDLRDELLLEAKLERTAAPDRPVTTTAMSKPSSGSGSSSGRNTILLTEFENTTGEPIFDITLKNALAFELTQSPMLDLATEHRIRTTMGLMNRPVDTPVNKELGYEMCLRLNIKAFVTGSISNLGSIYVLSLEAINSRTGESMIRQFEQASSREQVLESLGRAAARVRDTLVEALAEMNDLDLGFEFATTSSLEALKYYTIAREHSQKGQMLEAIPFYRKALEIDPNFVSVYMGLAVIYRNTNQWNLAAEMMTQAYELRSTASENEQLRIAYFYFNYVTGELDKKLETLQLWRKSYPMQSGPIANLSDLWERVGQSEMAIEVVREGLGIDASTSAVYLNLAESSISLGRFNDAKDALKHMFDRKWHPEAAYVYLYFIGFMENDDAAMADSLTKIVAFRSEHAALDLQAASAGVRGQWRKSQELVRQSVDMARRSNLKEVAAQYGVAQALRIAFWRSATGLAADGDRQLAFAIKAQTNNALGQERSYAIVTSAALAFAAAGLASDAAALTQELRAERPKDTLLSELWLPTIRAAMELQSGRPKDAIEELGIAERYERAADFFPQYLRGLAYLKLGRSRDASREFEKITERQGESPMSSLFPLAQLGNARALKDRAEYEKFFELWKDADADMPALVAAKEEFATLD